MTEYLYVYLCYIVLINLITFFTFSADKLKAVKNKYRISEKTLILLCLSGGALGGLLSMMFFNHKTTKAKFIITIPILIIIYTALTIFILNSIN